MALRKHNDGTSSGHDACGGSDAHHGACDSVATAQAMQPEFKVAFRIKAVAFICTTITLSWFFEGMREINSSLTPWHCFVLFMGVAMTLVLLGVQGYWIYIEERSKGTLKKRIGLFETIYARSSLSKRLGGDSGEES